MENIFKNFSKKDALYTAGAIASLAALWYVFGGGTATAGDGTQTDVPQSASSDGSFPYTTYNYPGIDQPPGLTPGSVPPADTAQPCGCGCDDTSPLNSGQGTFSSVDAYLTFLQNTNPNYIALQQVQLARYSALFAEGQTYQNGATLLGVSGNA
jgi:hypothetical protein